MKKFENFDNEEVDPFGEENWVDLKLNKEKMVQDCVNDIIYNLGNWRDWLREHLTDYFRGLEIEELKDFMGLEEMYYEPCDKCDGTGKDVNGRICVFCEGSGDKDIWNERYGV
jgi:hypothetical protein